MQFQSVIHPVTMTQIKWREDSSLNYNKAWTISLKAEKVLKFLLVSRSGLTLCRLWDALPRIAGVSGTERGKKTISHFCKNGLM